MQNKKQCFIIYGNHFGGLNAISDLAHAVKESFESTSLYECVSFSKEIVPNNINIIVEQFSSGIFCNRIILLKKKYPGTSFILFITEIPINGSYNLFDKSDDFNNFIFNFNLNNILSKIVNKNNELIFYDILIPILRFISILNYFKKILIKFSYLIAPPLVDRFFIRLKNKIHIPFALNQKYTQICNHIENYCFYARFINTKFLIKNKVFSKIFIINSSSTMLTNDAFGVEFIEFPYLYPKAKLQSKDNILMFSGTITNERLAIFDRIKQNGIYMLLNSEMKDEIRTLYSSRSMFSLHIPRYSSDISFSSPTRTIHAIKNGMLPLHFSRCSESDFEKQLNIPYLSDFISQGYSNQDLSMALVNLYNEKINTYNSEYENWNLNNKNKLLSYLMK